MDMPFGELPRSAAWRHGFSRDGFEVVFLTADTNGYRLDGHTVAVESGQPWTVGYSIALSDQWVTLSARIWGWSGRGRRSLQLNSDGLGRWLVDGRALAALDGCIDVDLESSCCTNTIPVHRLALAVGQSADAPAAYVRAVDLTVQRLEQQYARVRDDDAGMRYEYRAPGFEFAASLLYDRAGLVLEYPGIGSRAL